MCDLVFKGFLEYIKKINQPHYRHDVIINTETYQSISEFLENELLARQTDSIISKYTHMYLNMYTLLLLLHSGCPCIFSPIKMHFSSI